LELAAAGELTVRSNLAFRADPDHWEDQLAEFQDARAAVRALGRSALLRAETVKFFADGVIEGATAAMLEPYVGTADRGMPVWSDSELARAVGAFDALGFQAHIHAIGDAAIRAGLDAIETAIRENPLWDRRPVIAHVQLVDPLDLERFGQLGVVANFESYWSQPDPLQVTLTAPRLGAERTDRQYPAATLAELGAVLSHGSDWPVSTNNPVEAIWVAATRQTAAGDPPGGWVPTERLTLDQAIEAATWGSAYQGWTDAYRGRARVGYQADLVALTADLAEDGWRPADAAVAGVWLAGRQVG
jgi:predicted amidohydrolase YtcJ